MTAAVASTASKGEVLQEKSEDGTYSALELVVLLGKKKLSLLEEQKEACKTFLANSAKKGSARVYWSIVEWASSAVNLHPDDEEYWELLVTGQTLLTSVDKRGTQLPAKVGNVIMAALARAVKSGVTPSRLDTCLRLLTGPLHVICSLPALSTIVQEVATRLLQVSSEEVVPLALTLVTTIQCLIDVATPMTPRKRFDACIKTLLLPLCEVRAALVSMKDPMDLLLPLAVVSNQSTDSKPTLQGLGTATVEQTTSLIDQVFRICLFHEESLEEYASNTLAWKDLATLSMKDAKRTKVIETSDEKEQQEGGAKSKAKKEKKTKSEKHVGYTTQLFAILKQFVKDESTSAGAIATIPVLYKLYLEKQEAVNQQVNLTQANLIASQRDGLIAAKTSSSRQAGKRQRESVTLSSQIKVFFEFVSCCSSADAGQTGVAHLLRLVIDHSVYDISEHFESFELWFSEMFSHWTTEENQEAHVRAKVASIGLLLELDHRIINPRLNDLVTFSFSGSSSSPVGMFSPRGELLLRLVDTYVRLRQTVVFISALAAAIQRDSNAAFQFFMQQQQLLLSIGKLLAQVPSAQTSGLWLTLEGYVTSPEHGEAALPMSIVMSVFLKHIPVNDLNVVSLASLCGNLFDALETQEEAESMRILAAQAVILEAVASLSMLCGAWNHSRPDLVDRMRVVDLKQVKRYLSAIENQEGALNDETLCIFNAACRLALLSIRQSKVGSKDITVLLEIILRRLGPEQEAIILENIGVVSKYTSQKQLVNLWFLVFDKAVGSTLGQVSELGNASFYEVREMRDVLGDAAEKYLLQRPKVRGRALLVLSSVPKGYMTEGAAKTLMHQSLQYLEEAHAPACRMIATALKEYPDLVAAKDGLPSLSDLKSTVFATLNEPSLSVASTAAAGLCSRNLKSLLKFISSVLTSKSRANLLYALLGGLAKGARGKPFVQEKAADIAANVLEMCKELNPSTERRAQLLAFLLFWSEDTLSSTLLELTRETMQAQLLTKPTKALVEAVSLNIRKLNEDDSVMLVIKALQLCKTGASSSETEWVDLATQQLFKRTSATEQLPKLLALLVDEVLTLRTPGLEEHEAVFTQGVDAIYTLSLTLPLLLRSGTKFQDMVIETKGKDLVTTLILLGCDSRVLSKEDNVRCLKVVHALLMDCPGLWRSSSMRSIRLVLQAVADMEISDDPSLGLVTVNLLFGALKRQGPKLATKCASLVFHALDRCTRGIVKSVTSSGADLAVHDKAKWNDCLVMLARVCEELVAYKTVFKHYATYWLSNYIRLNRVAPLRLKTKNTLELAAFHWIAISSKHELQQVHGTADASGRDLLRSLRHAYARQKFRGLT